MINETVKKRSIIIFFIVFIFAVLSFFTYSIFSPEPTCNDKKQNQNEKGVDCGGPCSPCKNSQVTDILIQEVTLVSGGSDTYDVVARIYNPNDIMGAKSFDYVFTLKDASGTQVAIYEGKDFVLPVDSKYVTGLGIKTDGGAQAASVEMSILNPEWVPLDNIEKPSLGVYSKKYDKAVMGEGSEAEGILRNESSYDLNKISITVILKDANGSIIGVNKTEKNTVRVKEQRDFKINWPYALSGSVQKMEVDVQSNVLDPNNFTVTR